MKTMRVVLEVDVDDLPKAKRAEHARDMQIDESEIETLAQTDVGFAARAFENIGTVGCEELFAGSDTFVTFKDVRVQSAAWISSDEARVAVAETQAEREREIRADERRRIADILDASVVDAEEAFDDVDPERVDVMRCIAKALRVPRDELIQIGLERMAEEIIAEGAAADDARAAKDGAP